MWHKVSEKEKEEIERQAKGIMDSFAGKLAEVEGRLGEEAVVERDVCERVEDGGKCAEMNRKIMFENAPNSDDDFIIAEKGGW